MNINEKQRKLLKIKKWEKPTFITITNQELKKHIQAAARSGNCLTWGR